LPSGRSTELVGSRGRFEGREEGRSAGFFHDLIQWEVGERRRS
jgi:hypothetical protein